MRAIVDEDLCIGCGSCEAICPEVFELVDDASKVKTDPVPPEHQHACREAAEACPAGAISIED